MTDRRLVNIGDGRIVEMTEMGEGASASSPSTHRRSKTPKSNRRQRKKSAHRAGFKGAPEHASKQGQNTKTAKLAIPGYSEWLSARCRVAERFLIRKSKSRKGIPDGMRREEAEEAWALARQKAKEDMANLKKAGIMDASDERAEEAMVATLEVMRSPMNQQTQLQAARQVLEWTKAKPASKSEMTVNAAEAWLASLAEGEDKSA